jgi:GntR family transcriptional repressor for pyruvate dehydrogenase complex
LVDRNRGEAVARAAGSPRGEIFVEMQRELPLSDRVAQQLRDLIVSGRLKPGDQLPAERELAESFGVSRTVIREAVRSLAARGMVNVRSGSGSRVAAVDSSHVADSMQLYLQGIGGMDYSAVHEVRTVLEQRMAHLAAQRATDDEVETLRSVLEQMRSARHDAERAAVSDVEFHRTIAQMTGNPLFVVLLDSIREVLMEIRRATLSVPGRPEEAIDWHERILDRIADGDSEGAERAMRDHLVDSLHLWGFGRATPTHRLRRARASDAPGHETGQQLTGSTDATDALADAGSRSSDG